eukprot:CAMPEP_0117054750 /NCGR_PEP_ID=MMETSP0472-20121206/37942_1 /TAXON_ID=693140 ORGANISM="Tiarina fusus, Strain LIS" /NCGR_SAMPLE_ID=MMETSP0472 /ASSEMBLY_ACC=CAM_ASM_000603 /LENGTH=226 /DNA_ID=CAMNT_0004770455 /DNA_START=140 /DNA_END=820 /DNA_ORIENTATION=-
MVFGIQKLQNDVFCLTEERDYFQGKFLEQVSELSALKEELRLAKKEINKLRQQVMNTSNSGSSSGDKHLLMVSSPKSHKSAGGGDGTIDAEALKEAVAKKKKKNGDDDDSEEEDYSEGSQATDIDDDDDDEDHEAKDIRQSAEKLLQWASYRSSVVSHSNTPTTRTVATDHSSVSSSSIHEFDVPRTIQSASLEEEQPQQQQPQGDDEDEAALRDTARRLLLEEAA